MVTVGIWQRHNKYIHGESFSILSRNPYDFIRRGDYGLDFWCGKCTLRDRKYSSISIDNISRYSRFTIKETQQYWRTFCAASVYVGTASKENVCHYCMIIFVFFYLGLTIVLPGFFLFPLPFWVVDGFWVLLTFAVKSVDINLRDFHQ